MSFTVTHNTLSTTVEYQFTPRQQQIVKDIKQKLKQFTQPEIKANRKRYKTKAKAIHAARDKSYNRRYIRHLYRCSCK